MQMNKATRRTLLLLMVLAVLPLAGCEAFAQGLYYGMGGNQPAYYQQPQNPMARSQEYYLQQQMEHNQRMYKLQQAEVGLRRAEYHDRVTGWW